MFGSVLMFEQDGSKGQKFNFANLQQSSVPHLKPQGEYPETLKLFKVVGLNNFCTQCMINVSFDSSNWPCNQLP